jgi:hypothetical protein
MKSHAEQLKGDGSIAVIQKRLVALQPALKSVIEKGEELFDGLYAAAPHPSEQQDSPIYAVHSMNVCPIEGTPMARELTVVLGSGRWVRVFRTTEGSSDSYPRQRVWYCRPEGSYQRKTDIFRTHSPRRTKFPYEVDTSDYDTSGRCVGLIGNLYKDEEPFVIEASRALDDSREFAECLGYLGR